MRYRRVQSQRPTSRTPSMARQPGTDIDAAQTLMQRRFGFLGATRTRSTGSDSSRAPEIRIAYCKPSDNCRSTPWIHRDHSRTPPASCVRLAGSSACKLGTTGCPVRHHKETCHRGTRNSPSYHGPPVPAASLPRAGVRLATRSVQRCVRPLVPGDLLFIRR